MNKYFDDKTEFISNKRIFEAYFTETKVEPSPLKKRLNALLSLLLSLLAVLTSARARALFKAGAVVFCLIAFVGIIGAVERGSLSMGAALPIGIALIAIEILCLKKRTHSN